MSKHCQTPSRLAACVLRRGVKIGTRHRAEYGASGEAELVRMRFMIARLDIHYELMPVSLSEGELGSMEGLVQDEQTSRVQRISFSSHSSALIEGQHLRS